MIKSFFATKYYKYLLTIPMGSLLGYSYYYFIGCSSGSCGITSDPLSSTLFGMVFGYLMTPEVAVKKEDGEAVKGEQ